MSMKLIFKKDELNEMEVLLGDKEVEKKFSYVEMIKYLLEGNKFGETEFSTNISTMEKESIEKMLIDINNTLEEKKKYNILKV